MRRVGVVDRSTRRDPCPVLLGVGRVAAVGEIAVGGFEVAQIVQVALAGGEALQGDEVRQRADRRLHAVDASRVGACEQLGKAER